MNPYVGNKSILSLYPKILGIMPKHEVFWELFAGSAQITRKKEPAKINICVELDLAVISNYLAGQLPPGTAVINNCAISLLDNLKHFGKDHLIYADPPYLIHSRKSQKKLYNCELTIKQHLDFLDKANEVNCNMIISHYDDSLYNEILKSWNKITTKVSYRGVVMNEAIYYNYDATEGQLHSTASAGANKDLRQRKKRRVERWLNKFKELPNYERQAIIEALAVEYNCDGSIIAGIGS